MGETHIRELWDKSLFVKSLSSRQTGLNIHTHQPPPHPYAVEKGGDLVKKGTFWSRVSRKSWKGSAPIPLLLPGLGSEQSKNHRGDYEV